MSLARTSRQASPRIERWFWASVVLVALAGMLGPGLTRGQEPAAEGELQEVEPAPPAAAPAPAPAAEAPAEAPPEQSYLAWFYGALGLRYTLAFLLLSVSLVALVVMNFMATRRQTIVPPPLIAEFESRLKEKKFQEAYDLAKADESFLGQVLSAGLAKVSTAGYAEAIESMQEVGEEENMKLEQRLSYIALIGTLSPMVGLLGTVDGMVASFTVIARSTVTPKPSELAQGISMALVTTLVGLWLAIPAVAVYHYLKNRAQRLVLEAGMVSEQLMSRFSNVGAKKS